VPSSFRLESVYAVKAIYDHDFLRLKSCYVTIYDCLSWDGCEYSFKVGIVGMAISAVMLFVSATLLLYSAAVVPFQICMWDYSDPCNIFPTLLFDMFVDTFFLVPLCCTLVALCTWMRKGIIGISINIHA
jgi:hypothetical protein